MVLGIDIIPSELLRTFLIVKRTGSYTEAADILGLTQPAISLQIKRLQHLVGGDLFERGAGGFVLTSKGDMVERYATGIMNLNVQILRCCGNGDVGRTFRVGVQNVFASTHLLSLKDALNSRLPEHRALISFGKGEVLLDNLRAGYLDAAFVVHADTNAPLPGVSRDEIWEEPMAWVCSNSFVVGEGRPIPLLSWPKTVSDSLAVRSFSDAKATYAVAIVASDLTTHLVAARAGLGVFILPRRVVPPDLKIAEFHYLPRLPAKTSGVYVNESLSCGEARLLRDAIASAMRPDATPAPAKMF